LLQIFIKTTPHHRLAGLVGDLPAPEWLLWPTTGIEHITFDEAAGIEHNDFAEATRIKHTDIGEATSRAPRWSQVRWRMPNERFLVLQYERVRHTPSHPKLHKAAP
jgi:hypothetical protein